MDDYMTVYNELRRSVGVYTRLFHFPVGIDEVRHIRVTIKQDPFFAADLARLRKRAHDCGEHQKVGDGSSGKAGWLEQSVHR